MHGCIENVCVTGDITGRHDAAASLVLHFLRKFALAAHQKGGFFESNVFEVRFQFFRGHDLQLCLRRIVTLESPGNARCVFSGIEYLKTELFGEHGGGHGAVTQNGGPFRGEVHDGRLDTDFAFAAVEDHIELACGLNAQIIGHVLGVGRRNAAERVGRRRRHGLVCGAGKALQKRTHHRVRRAADGHGVLTAGDGVVDTIALFEDQRKRSRPECICERLGALGNF